MSKTQIFHQNEDAAAWILATLGKSLSLAMPLGLGKPNLLLNALYRRVKENPELNLKVFTALSLEIPGATSDLQRRFLDPFKKRHFGENYPELEYSVDLRRGKLPSNIGIYEFYFQAGKALRKFDLQKNYISLNYTHVAQEVLERGIQMIICIVAKHPENGKYSLSSNPDLTLDLVDLYRANGKHLKVVGVIHSELPFMGGDAEVSEDFFEAVVDSSTDLNYPLFALPREPVTDADFMVGLQASMLVEDGGTIQVGIGSLSDALVYCLCLRQQHNEVYREITDQVIAQRFAQTKEKANFHQDRFVIGLYGTSEMVMDAFMHLRRAGILKREVHDQDDPIPHYMHGAFFLGSKEFYQWLRERLPEGDAGLAMTRVSKVNDLYDPHEMAIRRQRVKARFFNMCMEMTLLGAAASDTREDGQVVSGVGGQFNFVAMSHELADAHSVMLTKSVHTNQGKKLSNIRWSHSQITIPRHLRDVFITEYGIAFTRGQTDEAVIQAMINLADSDFQKELVETAVRQHKLTKNYRVPAHASINHPESIAKIFSPYQKRGYFKDFPFGSDFTPVEEKIVLSLLYLKEETSHMTRAIALLFAGIRTDEKKFAEELARMELTHVKNIKAWVMKKLLLASLNRGR